MSSIIEQKKQIDDLVSLKAVTEALTEISSRRVKGSRDSILRSRSYYTEIGKVYREVRLVYQSMLAKAKQGKKVMVPIIPKNGRSIGLCLTSSIKFTRQINEALVEFFVEKTANLDMERVIVGRVGLEIINEMGFKGKYRSVIFSAENANNEIDALVAEVSGYSEVFVYHDEYVTILSQKPVEHNIATKLETIATETEAHNFIFEPEIEKVLQFFENEILRGLLLQSFFESDLAQYAKQMIMVESSTDNAGELIKDSKKRLTRAKMVVNNAKQLERISGFSLWNK